MTITGHYGTIHFDNKTLPLIGTLTMSKITQINKPFGKTLEFSTTVKDGRITGQEIVSSGPDALVAFKIDGEHALTGMDLRKLSQEILEAQFDGFALCTPSESEQYIVKARKRFEDHVVFSKNPMQVSTVWIVAELFANADHKTLYGEAAVSPNAQTASDATSVSGLTDNDEDEDGDDYEDISSYCPCGCCDDDCESQWDDYEDEDDEDDQPARDGENEEVPF